MGIVGFQLMVLWRSRLIIWKLQISLVSVIEVQDMKDLEHASATSSPPVGATGWPSSRIVEGLQWMTSFKDWRELMCFRFFLLMGHLYCQVIYSQFGLAIHQNDHQARRRFVEWAQNEIAVVPDFHKRILFIDEAHFWLNGYVNKQNCRIWSEANPQVYVETPLHPEKLTVWCALWAGGIIGPYFFKNHEGHNVTVNGDRYRAMTTKFFIPELNNHDVQELWFQQDGATCHTACATIDLLKDTFGDRLISRFGPVNWPPRSCDLTPLDYFLWGYVKSLVYADKPQTLDHLEDNIRRVIADIRPQMLEKVIENWTSRLDYIRASRGSPMPEIIFKM
ncbi:transposable element Tc3 transposase [Trichonephila clavipes]|nr:transposable element Tc3 transposase [Trichonephila clavipes]